MGNLCVLYLLVLSVCLCRGSEDKNLNSVDNDVSFENFGFTHCDDKDTSLSCQSIRIARNVLQQLMKARSSEGVGDLKIAEGVELVRTKNLGDGGRNLNDGTILGRMAEYLQEHELRVKFQDLVGKEGLNSVMQETLRSFNKQSGLIETGRKKKGDGGIMIMGLMMAKTLAAIGFGGLGLLTMKALMVSAMALMLSAIIGVKKLASSNDDGGHSVHYVQAHDHHRRKRMIGEIGQGANNHPYRGWNEFISTN